MTILFALTQAFYSISLSLKHDIQNYAYYPKYSLIREEDSYSGTQSAHNIVLLR